jgi:hypothetical protein
VYRASIALLIITWLRGVAVAGPAATPSASHDQDGAITSPWIDQSPALVLERKKGDEPVADHRLASGLVLASLYAGFSGWAYLAWYRNHPEKDMHDFGRDGWFGVNTYAGGADKLGHAWATMVLARGGTALLRRGGWDRTKSALLSALLSEGLFFAVEVKDYYYYEFSPGDFTFNTLGALTAIALDLSPRLDELIDFRVQWWPSRQYRNNLFDADSPCAKRMPGQPSCSRWNVAEDYSGETFLLAFHLRAIHSLRDSKYGLWSQFVDLSLGFRSRNYKPPPTLDPDVERTQRLFFGVSFNAQGLIDYLGSPKSTLRKVLHGVSEVITPPLTVPVIGVERSTDMPNTGGA